MKTEKSHISGGDAKKRISGKREGFWGFAPVCARLLAVCILAAVTVQAARAADDYAYRKLGRDRVLLMNNDTNVVNAITYQGYYNTNKNDVAYWVHEPADWSTSRTPTSTRDPATTYNGRYFYLKEGTNHTYYANTFDASGAVTGTRKLWQLRSCRAGSGAGATSFSNFTSTRHCLPWSVTTEPIDYLKTFGSSAAQQAIKVAAQEWPIPAVANFDSTQATHFKGIKQSANVVMRNDLNAAVFSPFYDEGVGVVIFDAVNGQHTATESLEIYAATNTLDGCSVEDADVATNSWNWIRVPVNRYSIKKEDAASYSESGVALEESGAESVLLNANASYTSTNHFFRIRADVQSALGGYTGPACFKIVRTSSSGATGANMDTSRLVILDNIQVGYPMADFSMSQTGREHAELSAKQVVGMGGVFSVPFPAVGQEDVKPRATFGKDLSFLEGIDGPEDMTVALRIDDANVHYRWRYLNQIVGDWTEAAMDADYDTGILTGPAMELPAKVGDVEYYIDAAYSTTHYKPIDYALWSHAGDIDYTGFYGAAYTNSFTATIRRTEAEAEELYGTSAGAAASPSKGTEYFFRLREGRSNYETFDIALCWGDDYSTATNYPSTMNGKGEVVNTIPMELVGDGVWRGVWVMPTNAVGSNLYVAFQGGNPQTAGATEWNSATNWFVPAASVDSWPASGLVTQAAGVDYRQRAPMAISSVANALIFMFEEESLTYSVARGDYQNFNRWTSAQGAYFTGNNVSTSAWSRAQDLSRADVEDWTTNYYLTEKMVTIGDKADTTRWEEHFRPQMELANIQVGVERSGTTTTPNGWYMENGAYVPEKGVLTGYDRIGNSGGTGGTTFTNVAAQLRGQGMGSLTYSNSQRPEGIDTVSFRYRVGQMLSFNNFSQNLAHLGESNYVLATKAVLAKYETDIAPVDPSLSLLAYYRQNQGSYEMRVTRVTTYSATRRSDVTYLKVGLYRWNCAGGTATPTPLHTWYLGSSDSIPGDTEIDRATETRFVCPGISSMCDAGATNAPSFYFGAYNKTASQTDIFCGVGVKDSTTTVANDLRTYSDNNPTIVMLSTNISSNGKSTIPSFSDTSTSRLTRGTYGLAANNCRAVFHNIFHTPVAAYESGSGVGEETFDGIDEAALAADERNALVSGGEWGLPKMTTTDDYSRIRISGGDIHWVAATAATQTLNVAVRESSGGDWTTLATVPVTAYGFATTNLTLRFPSDAYLQLATSGTVNDERTDVVVDDVSFTRLRGGDHPSIANSDGSRMWVFTQVWPIENETVSFQPVRGLSTSPMGIRTDYVTNGLSVFGFSYHVYNTTRVLVQTNVLARSSVNGVSTALDNAEPAWVTVTNLTLSAAAIGNNGYGSFAAAYRCRAPYNGLFRVIVDPDLIAECEADKTKAANYGRIDISNIYYWNDPSLTGDYWWGWNMRTTEESAYAYLADGTADPETTLNGLACILNFTALTNQYPDFVENELHYDDAGNLVDPGWEAHSPFIQSPYISNGVGKIAFKARVFDNTDTSRDDWYPSTITLYGAERDTDLQDEDWIPIESPFIISNDTFQSFSWETHDTDEAKDYRVIRFVVRGAQNGRRKIDQPDPADSSTTYTNLMNYYAVDDWVKRESDNAIMRVALDEIVLTEVVAPKLGFKNAMPFRDDLDGTNSLSDVTLMSYSQQPLLEESFGFQVQVVPEQMRELIDFDTLKVYVSYHVGTDVWGYPAWGEGETEIELPKAADWSEDRMVYRSRADVAPDSVIPAVMMDADTSVASFLVQYSFHLTFNDTDGKPHEARITDDTSRYWENPSWYGTFNANDKYAYADEKNRTPYTVLETLSPKRAWINEVNLWDGEAWNATIPNQFFEVAVPAGVSIKGWKLRITERDDSGEYTTASASTLALFGYNKLPDSKSIDTTNDYAFISVKSPKSSCAASGDWLSIDAYSTDGQGKLPVYYPYALELVRPSEIVEHRIVFGGQNPGTNDRLRERYSSETFYNALTNSFGEASGWVYIGDDTNTHSLAVCTTNGEFRTQWRESSEITPGKVNLFDDGATAQFVPPGWYLTPNGDSCWIRAYLTTPDTLGMSVGDGEPTAIFHVKKLKPARYDATNPNTWGGGTNIVYTASPWYAISSITTNETAVAEVAADTLTEFTLRVTNLTENISIYASAAPNYGKLTGLTNDSRYKDDVFAWAREKSPDDDSAEIYLADVNPPANATLPTSDRMKLEEMYWLDIDPFTTNAFYFGVGLDTSAASPSPSGPRFVQGAGTSTPTADELPQVGLDDSGNYTNAYGVVVKETSSYHPVLTNYAVTAYAYVSNVTDGTVWKPSRMLGLNGADSTDFTGAWDGPSFKLRGYLLNANVRVTKDGYAAPLRQFIIDGDSFEDVPISTPYSPYSVVVEVVDPFSQASPANNYPYFWSRWDYEANAPMWRGKSNIYWNLSLDDQQLPEDPKVLK